MQVSQMICMFCPAYAVIDKILFVEAEDQQVKEDILLSNHKHVHVL